MERKKNPYFYNNNIINSDSLNKYLTKQIIPQLKYNESNPSYENNLNDEETYSYNQLSNPSDYINNNEYNNSNQIINYPNEQNEDNRTISEKNYNDLINTIRKLSFVNDEQRSYIEVLKQTLESNLVKNGLSSLITSKSLNESLNFSTQNLKYIIDLSKLSSEIQKLNDDLNKQKSINEDITIELNTIKKEKQDLQNANKIIKDKLSELKNQGENLDFLNDVQKEQNIQNLMFIKQENQKLKNDLNEVQILCNKYEKDILDNGRIISDLKKQLDNYKNIEKEYNEIKDLNIKLEYDVEKLIREKKDLEEKLNKIKGNIEILKAEKSALNKKLNEKEIEIQKDKKKYFIDKANLITKLTKSKEINSELKNKIHDKEVDLIEFQQRQIENEKKNLELDSENHELKINYDDYKNETDFKLEIINKKNEDLIKQLNKIDNLYRNAEKENSDMLKNISEYKNKVKEIEEENEKIKTENEGLKSYLEQSNLNYEKQNSEFLNLNDTLIKLKNENNSLKKELPFWKEKYDKDIKEKTKEEERLKKSLNEMNIKLNDLLSNNNKILNSNNELLTKNNELENDLKDLYKNFSKIKDDNSVLSEELYDKLKIIQLGNESKKKLCNQANEQLSQIKDLEEKIGNIIYEKNKIEDKLGEQNCEYKKLKDNHDINKFQIESLTTALNNQKKLIEECSDIIISYIQQLRKIAFSEENEKIYYSEHYNHFINSCDILYSKFNLSPMDKLKIIKNFLTESSVENFDWYKQISDLEEANRLLDDKNISLKNQIYDYADTVSKANKYIDENESKFHHLLNNNYKVRENHSNLVRKYNKQNEKIDCLNNELNDLQDQNTNLTNMVKKLNRENMFIDNQLNQTANDLNSLGKQYDILNKEKNNYKDTLENMINSNDNIINTESFLNDENNNMINMHLTTIPNNTNKMYDSNVCNTFLDSDRYHNSYLKNFTGETQINTTSPNSDNINIQVNSS